MWRDVGRERGGETLEGGRHESKAWVALRVAELGDLTAAVTKGILSSEEERHGGAKEETYIVSACRSVRRADSIGVPKSQGNVLVSPTCQPK